MNSTNLKRKDGGTVIKQGDTASTFSFLLADETFEPIKGLDGQEATVRLFQKDKIAFEKAVSVSENKVTFALEQILPVGTFTIEIHVGGYVFPSDNEVKLRVEKSSKKYEVKELVPLDVQEMSTKIASFEQILAGYRLYDDSGLRDKITAVDSRVDGLSKRVDNLANYDDTSLRGELKQLSERFDNHVDKDTVYDDTAIKESIADVLLRLGQLSNYNDEAVLELISGLTERIRILEGREDKDTVYNDEAVLQAIADIRQQLQVLSAGGKVEVQVYDDTDLKASLAQLSKRLDDLVIPPAYDDSDVKRRLTALESKPEVDLSAYRLKNDPIELTPEQKLELKGERGERGGKGEPGRDGRDGERGANGLDGQNGKSAYQIWLDLGNQGSEQDFIASLKGADGQAGKDGTNGEKGQDGEQGVPGKSAYELAVEQGYTKSLSEWLQELKGQDGADGQKGEDGKDGVNGLSFRPVIDTVTMIEHGENPRVESRDAGETIYYDLYLPKAKDGEAGSGQAITIEDPKLSSVINPNLFLTSDGIDMRKGVGHGSNVKFEDVSYFKTTSPINDYIRVPALDALSEALTPNTEYTASFLTDDKVSAINFYFNSASNYRPTTIVELGNGQRIFSTTWRTPASVTPLTVHLQVAANKGTILRAKLEKGNVSTLIPESDKYALQILFMSHMMRELTSKSDFVKTTLEQSGTVVRSEYQSYYMSIDEMKAQGFVPANNAPTPCKFKKPFSKKPHLNILLDIQSKYVRTQYIQNITESGFECATNYGPDIKGVWIEGWVED